MKFSIAVYASPRDQDPALTAVQFAEAVIGAGHDIYRLFFFDDGVFNGVALPDSPVHQRWQTLIQDNQLDAVVCVTSARKRGIGAQTGTGADDPPLLPVGTGFTIGGLGQLIDAAIQSDRFITFGS